jgi:penicillin amidase
MRSAFFRTAAIGAALLITACGDDEKSTNPGENDVLDDADNDVQNDADVTPDADDSDAIADVDAAGDAAADGDADGSDEVPSACLELATPSRPTTDVEVLYDANGVAHIYAENRSDLVWAQGYEAARARLFQMDHNRRMAYGTRAEVFGETFVQSDRTQRSFRIRNIGEERWERNCALHPEAALVALAYASGVNAYIADMQAGANGAVRPSEFDRIDPAYVPDAWSPVDSLALGQLLLMSQSFQAEVEIAAFAGRTLMGEQTFADLFPLTPINATYITETEPTSDSLLTMQPEDTTKEREALPFPIDMLDVDMLDAQRRIELGTALVEMANALGEIGLEGGFGRSGGSNAWAVSGEVTADGRTMLCNDPHMPNELPSRLYPVHLVDLSVDEIGSYGHNMAGIPLLLMGANADAGWGLTNPWVDLVDIYREYLTRDELSVQFNDSTVALDITDEVIRVRTAGGGLDDLTEIPIQVRWVPHHGPIVNDILPPTLGNTLANLGYVFSARWTGFRTDTDEFSAILAMYDARSVDEQVAALQTFNAIAMSWVLADAEGAVGYLPIGPYPIRGIDTATQVPLGPYDGRGGAEWLGFQDFDDVPRLIEPAKGYVVSANNLITSAGMDGHPGNDGFYMQHFTDFGTRAHRITNRLEAMIDADEVSLESMTDLQSDVYSQLAEIYVPPLLALRAEACEVEGSTLCAALAELDGWDFVLDDSPGAAIFNVWMQRLWLNVTADDIPELLMGLLGRDIAGTIGRAIGHWLAGRDTVSGVEYWDNKNTRDVVETRDDMLLLSLSDAVAALETHFGNSDVSSWSWIDIHRVTHSHPVWADLNSAATPKPGGHGTVDAGAWRALDGNGALLLPPFEQIEGPLFRYCVALGADSTPEVRSVLSTGVSSHSEDPHFLDQREGWLAYEHNAVPVDRDAVSAAAVSTVTLSAGE